MAEFIDVYVKATGKKTRVPAHWEQIPKLFAPFEKTPSQKAEDKKSLEKKPATKADTTTDTPHGGETKE